MSKELVIDMSKMSRVRMAFCALFLKGTISDCLGVLCKVTLGQQFEMINNLITVVATVILLIGLITVFQRYFAFSMLSLLFFSLVWVVSGRIHPETIEYLNDNAMQFFLTCLPYMWLFYYMFGKKCNNGEYYENMCYIFKIGMWRTCIALFSQTIMFIIPSSDIYNDYMTASYTILLGAIFVLAYCLYLKPRKLLPKMLAIVSPLYMLILGCRGAFVFYLAFIILFNFIKFDNRELIRNRSKKIFLMLIFLIMVVVFIRPLANFMISMGINSHSIEMLASGNLFNDNIRMELYEYLMKYIVKNPTGYGIFSDRIIIPKSNYFWEITYCHNIAIELWLDFGVIAGTICIAIFVLFLIITLWKSKSETKVIVLALFCVSFLKLLVSSSIWQEQIFFALIGCLATTVNGGKIKYGILRRTQ